MLKYMLKTSKKKYKIYKSITLKNKAHGRYYGISGGPKIKYTKVRKVQL